MSFSGWIVLLVLGSALLDQETVRAEDEYSYDYGDDTDDVPLTPADFERAENLTPDQQMDWLADHVGPEEDILTSDTDKFEGDIVFPKLTNIWSFVDDVEMGGTLSEHDDYDLPDLPPKLGSAIKGNYNKWKNGVIPYVITSDFNSAQRAVIASAISEYDSNTCIRWVRRTNEKDYVSFNAGHGCFSYVGRTTGKQSISLGTGCLHKGIIVHEMMHAAGFFHEQSRADRDRYVTVKWGNIFDGAKKNFNKYSLNEIDHLGTTYDCDSIMHYGPTAFSTNGDETVVATDPKCKRMGQRKGLSAIDKLDLNRLYNCSATGIPGAKTGSCHDQNSYCKVWAGEGYCKSYLKYMTKKCAKSCDKCGKKKNRHPCKDEHRHCKKWADRGECSLNPGYMLYRCKKSCNQCRSKNAVQCTNTVTSCVKFKKLGYCHDRAFKPYMKKFCQKTCNFC